MPSPFLISSSSRQSGNILVYVLIGIILLGLLTVAIRNVGGTKDNIDTEDMIIKAGQVQRYASEVARGVTILLDNKVSENDIRFAHPDAPVTYGLITTNPENQVFDVDGGRARYSPPPAGVNDGSNWEFVASTDIPQVGSDRAELLAVLPNVTEAFCQQINSQLGFDSGTWPTDPGTGTPACLAGGTAERFTGTYEDTSPNVLDDTTFTKLPALQACVLCGSDGSYNYYYVLLAR